MLEIDGETERKRKLVRGRMRKLRSPFAAVGGGKYSASSEVWGNIAAFCDVIANIALQKF